MERFSSLPIVFQGLPRFDHPYASTAITLAKMLSKKRTVLYVEHPFTSKDVLLNSSSEQIAFRKKLWNEEKLPLHQPFEENPSLYVLSPSPNFPINFLPEGAIYQAIRKSANKAVWKQIDEALLIIGYSEFIYINSFDPVFGLNYSSLSTKLNVYHSVDFMGGERYIARHGVKAEKEIAQAADLVITTSKGLNENLSEVAENVVTVENGVDANHFSIEQEIPAEYTKIKGPKILYSGNIGHRLNYTFLKLAIEANPTWQWVFVGPINKRENGVDLISSYPNVHFLGSKPYSELPAYLQHADVCLLPFKCNELTRCIYPLKVNEYLAASKPVLATRFTNFGDLRSHLEVFYDLKSFNHSLQKTRFENASYLKLIRQQAAKRNTWEKRVEAFENYLKEAFKKKSSTSKATKNELVHH